MNHYSKEELDQYLHEDINFIVKRRIKKHLSSCSECSKVFEELKEDDKFLKEVRSSFRESTSESDMEKQTRMNLSSILGKEESGSSVA